MSDSKKAERIVEKWTADLKDKDRTRKAVAGNMTELFNTLAQSEIDFETARSYVDVAAKAHSPSPGLARKIYKDLRKAKMTEKTEREFLEDWLKDIRDEAMKAFYEFYGDEYETKEEEKKFGSMSVREYKAQRKYAESFPEVTYEELLKRMKSVEVNLNEEITLDDLENQDGE